MLRNKPYFTIGQYLFWILVLLLVVFAFFHVADRMFSDDGIVERIVEAERPSAVDTTHIIEADTTKEKNDDLIPFTWRWKDYSGISRCLKSIVEAFKKEIKSAGISNYQESLDFVVSAIQSLGYTFVCRGEEDRCGINGNPAEDCRPPKKGFFFDDLGCCDNVVPLAVYAPFEFAFQQTGDCDTKSLFAYTILKEMGYEDVAVLVGMTGGGGHSMLGVKIPNPSYNNLFVTSKNGSKYYAWEVTQGYNKLGQNCWSTWHDWRVSIN
jgi:hypothetical protein